MHEKAKNHIMQSSENQLKSAIGRCAEIIKSMKKNDSMSHENLRQEMLEYYLAARGVALMQELALIIKKI